MPGRSRRPVAGARAARPGQSGGVISWAAVGLTFLINALKALIPVVTTFLLLILSFITLANPELNLFLPILLFPATFFWLVHRRSGLPKLVLFGLGLIADSLAATPLGMTSVILLVMHYVIHRRELTLDNSTAWSLWILFASITIAGLFLTWVVMSLLFASLFDPTALTIRGIATVLSYPLVYILLIPVDRLLLALDRS